MVAERGSFAVAATEWKVYNDSTTGFRVFYPSGWLVKAHPEPGCAFKISGVENGVGCEFQVRNNDGALGVVMLASPQQGWAKVASVYNKMLGSLERTRSAAPAATSAATAAARVPAWDLVPLTDNAHTPLRVSYPKNWQVTKDVHDEHVHWKINGTDAAGKEAELSIWASPRWDLTLDKFVDIMEDEHFKPLPNYVLVRRGRRTVSGVETVTHSITFTVSSVPARMDTMFFVDRDHVYCVGLSTATWSPEEMRDLVDRVAGSIRL